MAYVNAMRTVHVYRPLAPGDRPQDPGLDGRCSKCGRTGLTFTHPSWGGNDVGWSPFPVDQMVPT
jgi:hypothetical protein